MGVTMNSRAKGARGERAFRDLLRAEGYEARRGQQFSGSPDSPDVVCPDLAQYHFEIKCVERLNIEDAMAQALNLMSGHDLDVRLVSYGPPTAGLRALVR